MKPLLVVFVLLLLIISGAFLLVWPNTYLSQINISLWPKPLVKLFLKSKSESDFQVIIDGRMASFTYSDLGVAIDIDETMAPLNTTNISDLINNWVLSPSRITIIQPVANFGENFDRIAIEKLPKRSLTNENAAYNKELGLFDYSTDKRKARIDTVDLQAKMITYSSILGKPFEVQLISEDSDLEKKVNEVNKKLSLVHRKPLDLILDGKDKKVSLSSEEIISLLKVETKDYLKSVDLSIDKESVSKILDDKEVVSMSNDWTIKNIANNLLGRYNGGELKPIVLGVDVGPNSDGSLAAKYIEVDLSQQRMYFFENGNVFKTYIVSTGLNYPTPVGSYKIKNKIEMGFSGIFNVWMPWWMAFEYREDIGAYLGIHELPYRLTAGQKIYRFGNYIGSRKTGGCIALSPGEAKEVYDKSSPGMDVVIYQ